MVLGEDGFLYVLATDQIVKVDIDRKEVTGSYHFWRDEMTAMVDAVYSVDENKGLSFIVYLQICFHLE